MEDEDLEHRTSLHKDSHEDSEEEILFDLNLSDDEGDRNLKDKLKLDNEPGSLDEKDDDTGSLTESCFNEKETIAHLLVEHFVHLSYTLYYDLPLKPESKEVFVSYLESCLSDMLAVTHHAPCTQWMDQSGECSTLMSYTHIDCTHLLPWIQRAVRRAQDQCLDSRSLMKLMATLFLLSYRSKKHSEY
ncbi:uncharacterized protein LOC113471414 [Diaphorina citri]|uniref:Uncharacterized protein LOC113471414 n=1 Tax=Diaphorina citri TaxID=121845 RepID=A0A3Q0JD34_DIACI|nr:uncharacterized protein LOC113471414 [Diaphorina citri]